MSFRIGQRSDPLPLPTESWTRPENRPDSGVSGQESRPAPDGFEARSDRLLETLRRDPSVPEHSSGDYGSILEGTAGPLAERTVTRAHERDDPLVEKLVGARDPDGDPEVERAVALARDTAVLDHAVNEVSDGGIRNLSGQVSARTLERVKEHVADAIRDGPHEVDGPVIGKSVRGDPEATAKLGVLARVKAAVGRAMDMIHHAVSRAPINAVAKEVGKFSKARLDGVPEQQVAREMAASIGRLGNADLLKLYRTTLSLDMVDYRLGLASRAEAGPLVDPEAGAMLEGLNSYEAMVHAEVIERSLQPAPEMDGFQPIDHGPKLGQMGALANTEKRAAHRELGAQSDAYLRGDPWADRTEDPGAMAKVGPTGLTVGQVSDALRSADLTINVGPKLFAKGGPFRDQSGALLAGPRLKNIYELPQAKGPLYLERRQMVEHALEPATERADREGIDPGNHPISAGVNVGRRIAGSAPGYGEIVLVLKDSVKDRCTFTASDSFNAPFSGVQATPEKIAQFKARVAGMLEPGGGLSEPDRQRLAGQSQALSNVFVELDRLAVQGFPPDRSMEHFLTHDLLRDIDGGRIKYQLATAAMDSFMERSPAGSDHVTTPERMSHLIADLNQNVVDAIATSVQDEQRINLPVNKYIEAQVYGGIDLANDVAEIRFFEKDTSQMAPQEKETYLDSLEGMRRMADELGIRVVRYKPEEAGLTHL
jgi:hypothetical protein